MDMRLPLRRLGRIWPFWACGESRGESWRVTCLVEVMVSPLATRTVGPDDVLVMFLHTDSAEGWM